ncbi:stage II sporulation protein P [Tumebacillus permanentifrigoris]|uniref:Stage II sporulation protein P n=1 Tax=Tumebacillus permanentifrigoris TaxID=378543 RepID=A0A316D5P8_9BACL|nr:stage II sporulation protein P [Tumebacillus permanentifrigoris]PWK08383.1 stage II sporulation protein P [Tumebacillus permanentifrigoris]
MKKFDHERKRRFRSLTLNLSSQRARTAIITMGLATAVFSIIVCVVAVQLITGGQSKGLAGRILHSISVHSLNGVMSQELPMYASIGPTPTLAESNASPRGLSNMLLYLFTDIDAGNPLTMLGFQVPGMAVSDFKLLTPDPTYTVPPSDDHADKNAPPPNLEAKPREKVEDVIPANNNEPLVYIYHSHNRESFLPDLPQIQNADRAYDAKKNIEQAGSAMLEELKKNGVPTLQTLEDYWTQGSFDDAYDYSRVTVQKVLKEHKDLKLIFDIHRDSLPRDKTTFNIDGVDYAMVYFIVGGGNNPHSDQNQATATKLQEYMNKMYPGLTRGVWKKGPASYDTRYNQDLNRNMVLIEIGGPGNSLEEEKRTAALLGKAAAQYLKDIKALSPEVQVPVEKPLTKQQQDSQQRQEQKQQGSN